MRHRIRFASAAVLALSAIAAPSCGSKNAGWQAGEASDGSADGLSPDAFADDGPTANCGAVPPHGTHLVASPSVAIDGVTTDGYAVYTDASAMTVNAVPVRGGPPLEIGTVDSTNSVFISGNVVYFEPAVASTAGLGTASLAVWTAAAGTVSLSNSVLAIPASAIASGNGRADVSLDGSHILFFESRDGLQGTLMVATTDGRTILPLVANLDMTAITGCRPSAVFAGSSVVAAYCSAASASDAGAPLETGAPPPPEAGPVLGGGLPEASPPLDAATFPPEASVFPPEASVFPPEASVPEAGPVPVDAGRIIVVADAAPEATTTTGDAGSRPPRDGGVRDAGSEAGVGRFGLSTTNAATLAAFTGAAFSQEILANGVQTPFAADRTGTHVLVPGPSGLVLYSLASGVATPLDATGAAGRFTKNGANVIYSTSTMALKRSPVATPSPLTLVSSGVGRLLGLSPDESWALTYQGAANGGQTFDLFVSSAVAPAASARLSMGTSAALYGDAFTADSSYVLYFDNVSGATGVGDFYLARAATGETTKVASYAWVAAATAGTKVLVSDNCATCDNQRSGLADIEALDGTHPADTTTIVSQAFANFYLTSARDKVVYSWTCEPGPMAGIYALPVP